MDCLLEDGTLEERQLFATLRTLHNREIEDRLYDRSVVVTGRFRAIPAGDCQRLKGRGDGFPAGAKG